jgi:hypothetical protein
MKKQKDDIAGHSGERSVSVSDKLSASLKQSDLTLKSADEPCCKKRKQMR